MKNTNASFEGSDKEALDSLVEAADVVARLSSHWAGNREYIPSLQHKPLRVSIQYWWKWLYAKCWTSIWTGWGPILSYLWLHVYRSCISQQSVTDYLFQCQLLPRPMCIMALRCFTKPKGRSCSVTQSLGKACSYLKILPCGGYNEKAGVLIPDYFVDWEFPTLGWYFKIKEYRTLLTVICEYY